MKGYEELGSGGLNLLLKSAGKVKILWGNKAIDLLDDDGNVLVEIIKEVNSKDSIGKNGVYVVDNSVYVLAGSKTIELVSAESSIPKGSIIMWHGDEIPEGWAICDGQNGTPDLIGKFIKAGETEEEGGEEEFILDEENIPTKQEDFILLQALPYDFTNFVEGSNEDNCMLVEMNGYPEGSTLEEKELTFNYPVSSSQVEPKPIKIEPKFYSLIFIMKIS